MMPYAKPVPAATVHPTTWTPWCETCRTQVKRAHARCPDCGGYLGITTLPSHDLPQIPDAQPTLWIGRVQGAGIVFAAWLLVQFVHWMRP